MTNASEWAISRSVNLGKGLSVEFTAGPAGFVAEWNTGSPPDPRKLSKKQMKLYRAGRDAVAQELGRRLGGGVLMIELR
jgi:hypothetical protein